MKKTLILLLVVILIIVVFGPAYLERMMNVVEEHEEYKVSKPAIQLHDALRVMDWHTDTLMWQRDILDRSSRGQSDVPRAADGNVHIQMYTVVTKSPSGLNNVENSADSFDDVTGLAVIQRWPISTWSSLKARALFQAKRLHEQAAKAPERVKIVKTQQDLRDGLAAQANGHKALLTLLGTEGSHALDGEITAVDELFEAGFRMFGLQHFFDNKLGGSLHGEIKGGLTAFGLEVLNAANKKRIIIDLAHSSEAVVKDVLTHSDRPVVVSHTGFKGACDTPRNIGDELMKEIAAAGGLIAVGFWPSAVCDISPAGIVRSIRYGIDLVGVEHVALGSDFDGSVTTALDISELSVLTEEMQKQGFTEQEIRNVMGENSIRFLLAHLPQ